MKNIILNLILSLKLKKIHEFFFVKLPFELRLRQYELESNQKINFVNQGGYTLFLLGDLKKFKIDKTSHLKSDTTIECTGGVEIGKYFHTGKGLTIFSANHNWKEGTKIPYDEKIFLKKVKIEDFVWLGADVSILPGITIGEGAIVAAGSVVTKNVNKYEVVGGNPAKIISTRDKNKFNTLKKSKLFF